MDTREGKKQTSFVKTEFYDRTLSFFFIHFYFTENYNPLTKFYIFKIFHTHLIYIYDIRKFSHCRYDNVIFL